jgi:hypothetical protein
MFVFIRGLAFKNVRDDLKVDGERSPEVDGEE